MDSETKLRTYFETRSAFSISKLEKEAGVPRGALYRWLTKVQQYEKGITISKPNLAKVVQLLTDKYGY